MGEKVTQAELGIRVDKDKTRAILRRGQAKGYREPTLLEAAEIAQAIAEWRTEDATT